MSNPKVGQWFVRLSFGYASWMEGYEFCFAIIKLLEYPKEGYTWVSARHKGFWYSRHFHFRYNGFGFTFNIPNIKRMK